MPEPDLPEQLVEGLEERPRLGPRRFVTAAGSALLVLALLGFGLPYLAGASWPQIAAVLAGLPPSLLVAAVVLGLAAIACEAVALRLLVPGSRLPRLLPAYSTASAAGLVIPGGALLGTGLLGWLLRREGIRASAIVVGLLALSIGDMAVSSVLVPLAGLVAYALAGTQLELPGTVAAVVVAVLGALLALGGIALVLSRPVLASISERLAPLVPQAASALGIRDALVALLRRRGAAVLALQTLSRIAHLIVLGLALGAVGADLPLAVVVAVFALGRVLALFPLTPGGSGITEAVSAASLVALGVAGSDAAAATLVLMVATLLVPVAAGGISAAAGALRPPAGAAPSAGSAASGDQASGDQASSSS